MNVFCDFHHADLYHSLKLLFEKRLGMNLYRSIGMEWYAEQFWNVYPLPTTAKQYLGLQQAKKFISPVAQKEYLEKYNYIYEPEVHYIEDISRNTVNRAITLDKFKQMQFDIVIASIPQHIEPFKKLIQLYQPKAKLIFQVGNAWTHLPGVSNLLSSTAPFEVGKDVNTCFYHQEFDLEVFKYTDPTNSKIAHSYIHYMKELDLLSHYKAILPDWTFTTYGCAMDKALTKTLDLANAYSYSGWTWHVKPEGDGYGHTLHHSYACGRPTIIKANYYQNKIGSQLLEDCVTCIDISRRSIHENTKLLQKFSDPELHLKMCKNAFQRFADVVNFDIEEKLIRCFLARLI